MCEFSSLICLINKVMLRYIKSLSRFEANIPIWTCFELMLLLGINIAEMNDGLSFPRHMPLLTMNPGERLVKSSAWVGSLFDTTDSPLYSAATACAEAVAFNR